MTKQTSFLDSLKKLDTAGLDAQIKSRRDTIRRLRFDLSFGTVAALSPLRTAKQELAQLLTSQRQRRSDGAPTSQKEQA